MSTKWNERLLRLAALAALAATILTAGCQWATTKRSYEPQSVITRNRIPARRYFRVKLQDGSVKYAWMDQSGKLHIDKGGW